VTPFPWVAVNGSLRSPAATLTKGVLYQLSYISLLEKRTTNCVPATAGVHLHRNADRPLPANPA
jgi:hypothetical protein